MAEIQGLARLLAVGCGWLFSVWTSQAFAEQVKTAAPPERAWTIPSNEDIRRLLAERLRQDGVGIVVGIIEPAGRRVIAYGKSGAPDARPLDGDTLFQIGSVTKVFTTLLLADMVQRGEVRLDDPASKYLPPGVSMPERGRPITLLDLATHMSGLPSMPANFDLQGKPNPYEAYSVQQLNELLSSYTLEREPGVKFEYSNLGVALLGRLLARRGGMDYEALLKERVLQPLRMNSTAITLTREQARRLAPGHDRYLQLVETWNLLTLPASGSLRSTANDLLKLLAAHLGYQDTPLKAAMEYQRATRSPAKESQALGWAVRKIGNDDVFNHEGGKEGYRSCMAFNLGTRTGIVVLANARTDERLGNIAHHLLSGRPLAPAVSAPPMPEIVAVNGKTLDSYAGQYQTESSGVLTVARKDTYLWVELRGSGVTPFFPDATNSFFANTDDMRLTFETDAEGRVNGLKVHDGDHDSSAHRIQDRPQRNACDPKKPAAFWRIFSFLTTSEAQSAQCRPATP